jgi:molecular chaperone HtpG
MKEDMNEFLEERRLKDLMKKHSEFISFPLSLQVEKSTNKKVIDSDEDEKKEKRIMSPRLRTRRRRKRQIRSRRSPTSPKS